MDLRKYKPLTHISPHSFMEWLLCQYKFYEKRLSGREFAPQETNLGAAVGTAFDCFIKDYIVKKRKDDNPLADINKSIQKLTGEHKKEAIEIGKEIAQLYIKLGFVNRFLDVNREVQVEQELYVLLYNIPILGHLDLSFDSVPLDWKTKGFGSKYPAYPIPGYYERWDINRSSGRVEDKIKTNSETDLVEVNKSWAIQLLFYNFLLGNRLDYPFFIEEICLHKDIITFAFHKGQIPETFVTEIMNTIREMWDAINDRPFFCRLEEPSPCANVCEPFKSLCPIAPFCKYYELTLGDPERRMNYV